MKKWLWFAVIAPTIGAALGIVPVWLWVVIAGLAIGWAFKQFGWQGVVGAVGGALAFLSYREGWKARDSIAHEHVDGPDASLSPPKPKPVRRPRPTIFSRKK